MSNESNLKLKVKVDATELDKLSSKLKGIDSGDFKGTGSSSGEEPVAATKAKKIKVATEELTKSQQYAAEVSKLLSEEQSQLATNFDFAEVGQKALGQAMQQFGGISAANVGILMGGVAAIGALISVGYEYYGAINQQSIALKEAGIISEGYSTSLYNIISAEQALALSVQNTSLGLSTNINDIEQYGQALIAIKSRFGQAGEGIVNRALEGDAAAMRMLGIRVDETSTRIERQIEARLRLAQTPILETREQSGVIGTVTRWAGDAAAFFGFTVASIERIKQRNQEEQRGAQERNAANIAQQNEEERLQRLRIDFANQLAQYDRDRMERTITLGATVAASDDDLARERRVNEEEYQRLQNTTGLTGQALQDRLNRLRDVGTRIQTIDAENARRHNTAAGIRERMRDEALRRGLEAGRNINQLERIQISNGKIRAELELRIAELRKKLVGLTGQDAQAVRNQIAGMIGQLQGLSAGAGSKPLIALTEIRNMIQQIQRALAETSQSDFMRGIQQGTLSIEEQMRRLGLLQNQRADAERRNQEALAHAGSLAEQLENATTNRERQRLAIQQRKANEEVTRTQETLRTVSASYDAAGQAIARNISERESKAEQERINAEKLAYDSRARALQNQTRNTQDALGRNRTIFDAWIADQQGSASDYQRSIADMFNPEQMISQIQQGVQQAGALVSQESARLAQMQASGAAPEELANQTQRVIDAQRAQTQATRESEQAIMDLQERMRDASPGTAFIKSLTNGTKGMADMASFAGGLGAKGLNLFSDAIWGSLDAIKSGEDIGAALNKMLSATLQSIGQEATIKALMETAAGIAATVTPGLQATAPGHFAAAGIYAGVAAAAGIGYMALPTPPSKEGKEKESTTADRELLNAQRREQNIIINGSAYMTKEELSKAARKIADYGKDL